MANTPWNGNCSRGERSKAKVPSVEGGFSGTTLSGTSLFSLFFVSTVLLWDHQKKISPPGYMWRVFYGGIGKKEMLNAVFSSSYTIDGEITSLKRMDL